jgi:hypothetical protein
VRREYVTLQLLSSVIPRTSTAHHRLPLRSKPQPVIPPQVPSRCDGDAVKCPSFAGNCTNRAAILSPWFRICRSRVCSPSTRHVWRNVKSSFSVLESPAGTLNTNASLDVDSRHAGAEGRQHQAGQTFRPRHSPEFPEVAQARLTDPEMPIARAGEPLVRGSSDFLSCLSASASVPRSCLGYRFESARTRKASPFHHAAISAALTGD